MGQLKEVMLTTFDNPYDPFEDFDRWWVYDEMNRHATSGLLARVIVSSDELSQADQFVAMEQAIDEILDNDVLGIYLKVHRYVDQS